MLFIIFCITDTVIGKSLSLLLDIIPNNGNDITTTPYALNKVDADVLIVGSSRARHHYNPRIISDSLKLSTYNIGKNGNYLSYNCCIINSVIERYQPKIIFFDIKHDWLLEKSSDSMKSLYPFYHKNNIIKNAIIDNEGSRIKIKLLSKLYAFNDIALRMIIRYLQGGKDHDQLQGFDPLYGSKITELDVETKHQSGGDSISKKKMELLEKTICNINAKGIKVYLFDSPFFQEEKIEYTSALDSALLDICKRCDVRFYDNRYVSGLSDNIEFFYDFSHLNNDGAELYTNYILEQIKE